MKPLISLAAVMISASSFSNAAVPIRNGDKVAFLGDSITQQGFEQGNGYVRLVEKGLAANDIKIEVIPAGISGHKSNDMLGRLDRDVLSKKPDWMLLSCGVNDVWHGPNGVALPDYKTNITSIVEQAQKAKVKVIILTSTMIHENPETPENLKLADYNAFLRDLAKQKRCLLADLNVEMRKAIAAAAKKEPQPAGANYVTTDGVHMAPAGNRMMATGILKAIGFRSSELAKAKKAWEQ